MSPAGSDTCDVDSATQTGPTAAAKGWETTVTREEVDRVNAGRQLSPSALFLKRASLVLGPLGVTLAVVAMANPWRLVVLYPVGVPILSSLLLGLAWAAVVFGVRAGRRGLPSVLLTGLSLIVSAALVLNVVVRIPLAGGVLGSTHLGLGEVVAISPDNRFEVVWYDDGPAGANPPQLISNGSIANSDPRKARVRLVLRARAGVLTHDGPSVIGACFGPASKEQVARFTGPTTVEVRKIDTVTTITFDPDTLVASGIAEIC